MERYLSAVALLALSAVVAVVGVETEGSNSTAGALVEARYDHYEDIFRYWWPWFTDLSTVVAIKLKIWIVLVAMHVFGDGYYWSKWTGSGEPTYHQPPGFGWGRRKRRAIDQEDTGMAELIFNQLDIEDDTCRKRIVCELYLEGKRVPELWRALAAPGYEVFRAYRPKATVRSSAQCRKLYQCELSHRKDGTAGWFQQPNALTDTDGDDWRWPR
ncbi:uncharacterized protein LOC121602363 [Anopheles merus]|uniref:uncharacterized protein LOC121592354 n=1 Tax=Anopheles merus TaxID=30066 RepID=UPI001BE40544|nr:uncharacterized protein LOC121592354 [Anopheles merus]XP_041787077.1 uncharacterized protein LOC121602363 [Anopheles merus]